MACVAKDNRGWRVLFVAPDGARKTLRLGPVDKRTAESIRCHVESLLEARITGQAAPRQTAVWLSTVGDKLRQRLARVGLVEPAKQAQSPTLADFLDSYIAGRTDVGQRTRTNLGQARKYLVQYFGAERRLGDITPGDADEWRRWLSERLGINTVRRHCGRAKQFFRAAVRKRLLAENPFADMGDTQVRGSPERFHFVTLDEAQRVLDACPDAQWRLIFGLARWAGLRTPSETLALRWCDVNWEQGTLTVTSVKTRRQGKAQRVVPIFPELRPLLEAVYEQAEPGTFWVITRYRLTVANLRTQFQRIVARAGLVPWEKPFQNCRATRETELLERFPLQCVTAWLGNTARVAHAHYLQVRPEYVTRAITEPTYATVAQNPAQQSAETRGMALQAELGHFPEHHATPLLAATCENLQLGGMPPEGLEPSTL